MNRFLQYVLLISSLLLIPSMASAVLLEEEPRLTFMWKVHGLYLAEVRVLLLGDGDLGGTVRQSAKDRTLYEASGKLQAYTKVASDRVLHMRHIFTDIHDGERTDNNPLPVQAKDRLLVFGYRDLDYEWTPRPRPERNDRYLLILVGARSHLIV